MNCAPDTSPRWISVHQNCDPAAVECVIWEEMQVIDLWGEAALLQEEKFSRCLENVGKYMKIRHKKWKITHFIGMLINEIHDIELTCLSLVYWTVWTVGCICCFSDLKRLNPKFSSNQNQNQFFVDCVLGSLTWGNPTFFMVLTLVFFQLHDEGNKD